MKKAEKLEMKKQLNKQLKILLGTVAIIFGIAFSIYFFTQKDKSNESQAQTSTDKLIREFNHRKGPDTAKVKIVEFYDPECEACAAFFPYVKEILSRYPNDIQLIVRYALYHGNSMLAAKASDAAALQGKFWDFQELLFLNQHEWSHKKYPATDVFLKYAQDLSLDLPKFRADMEDLKRMETISIDMEDGPKLGVNGTPTIFINGKKLETINPKDFKEMVEAELKK